MTTLPLVNPEVESFEIWRWRLDHKKWCKVASKGTLELARIRRDEEVEVLKRRKAAGVKISTTTRITRSVTTRIEVD